MRLEVRNLIKTYKIKNQDPVKALDDVSLLFPETGLVFILGKSGSGKSTLLNVMGGLDSLDGGEIIINDRSSKDFSGSEMDSYRNTYLGFIFQEYNILNDFNIHDNVALAIELQNRKADDATIEKILEEVDLKGFGKRKPSEMSGGQKQRVAIARALVKDPKIIFADEPTGALDSNTGKAVFETLKKLSETRLVVCVSHDRDFAEHFGDRVIEMKDGKVISDITKRNVAPEEARTGISMIGANVIRLEKGRELTAADLPIINAALKKSEGQAFISVDPHVNETICESARISKDGERQEFFDTDQKEVKAGTGKWKAIKSRFPMRDAFRMGVKSLAVKPVRLVFTILLSFSAFALFGLTATMARVDSVSIETNTLYDSGIRILDVTRSGSGSNTFSQATADDAASAFGTKVHPYINFDSSINQTFGEDKRTVYNPYYLTRFSKVVAYDDELRANLGFTLESGNGRLPEQDNEILVTDWYTLAFKDFGYYTSRTNFVSGENFKVSDILGTKIGNYTIVGILSTGIESKLSEFSQLKGLYSFSDYEVSYRVQGITGGAKAGLVFMTQGGLNKYAEQYGSRGSYYTNYSFNIDESEYQVNFSKSAKSENIRFFSEGKTSLEEDEVAISENMLDQYIKNVSGLKKIGTDSLFLSGIAHCENSWGENVSRSPFETTSDISSILYNAVISSIALDKKDDFATDYPELFAQAVSADNWQLRYDANTSTFTIFDNDQGTYVPCEPNTFFEESSRIGYLYQFMTQEWSNYLDYSTGKPRDDLDESEIANFVPYYSLISTYRESINETVVSSCLDQGFGLSLYNQVVSNLRNNGKSNYATKEVVNAWWTATHSLPNSFISTYIAYQQISNPDYKESDIGERERQYIFTYFLDACEYGYNQFVQDEYKNSYAPLEEEEAYYNGFATYVRTEKAKAAGYLVGEGNASDFIIQTRYKSDESMPDEGRLHVVGVYMSENSNSWDAYLYANMATLEKYVNEYELSSGVYYGLLVETPTAAAIRGVVSICDKGAADYEKNDYHGYYWRIEEPIYNTVYSVAYTIGIMMQVFLYVGLFFLAFSMLLFYTFISASINNKRREIGILRAVGARGSDVFKVFYSESFVVAIINFALAAVTVIGVSIWLNFTFADQIGFQITLLKPGVIEISLVLAAALLASFISALLPVLRIAHQKPIDAIRDR